MRASEMTWWVKSPATKQEGGEMLLQVVLWLLRMCGESKALTEF